VFLPGGNGCPAINNSLNVVLCRITNPDNTIVRNVAIASDGTGFWNSFVGGVCCEDNEYRSPCRNHGLFGPTYGNGCPPEGYSSHTLKTAWPSITDTREFAYNEASSCRVGINWDGAAWRGSTGLSNNPNDQVIEQHLYSPPHVPVFRGLVMYKNSNRPHYFRGQLSVNDDWVVADNNNALMWAYEAILSNSLVVGWSQNAEARFFFEHDITGAKTSAKQPIGMMLYDGPTIMRDVLFAGFPSSRVLWDDAGGLVGGLVDVTPRVLTMSMADDRMSNVGKRFVCVCVCVCVCVFALCRRLY
jgi:hypothetical protein